MPQAFACGISLWKKHRISSEDPVLFMRLSDGGMQLRQKLFLPADDTGQNHNVPSYRLLESIG